MSDFIKEHKFDGADRKLLFFVSEKFIESIVGTEKAKKDTSLKANDNHPSEQCDKLPCEMCEELSCPYM